MSITTKILVVDDDADLLAASVRVLNSAGYAVSEAASGAEAVAAAKSAPPDLILLDVALPDRSGIDVCREIKEDPACRDCFIVLISSAMVSSTHQADGLEAGADGYIARPIANRELLARIEAMVRIKKSEEGRKRLIAELERSNRDLQQFAYAASHDLKEPLRMISSYLRIIESRYGDRLDADAAEFIGFAVDGADRLGAMIEGLLEFSRVHAGALPTVPVPVAEVLEGVRRDLDLLIRKTGAEISWGAMPVLPGDPVHLARLFQNLIVNAIKFTAVGARPRVRITSTQAGPEHIFRVQDNGIGIESRYFDRIFSLFQRLHTREEYPGTGIGLAVCRRIVEAHGGRIWVESAPGEGASFYFSLPAEAAARESSEGRGTAP